MHQIHYLSYSTRKLPKTIQKECDQISKQNSDSGGGLYSPIRFRDIVLKNYNEAAQWIDDNDRGWYDQLAVKYKDKQAIKWLVKIEYHT